MFTIEYIEELKRNATPINDSDWGTERQIYAENAFFDAVAQVITSDEYSELETYCLKARTEEMLAEGMRLATKHIQERCHHRDSGRGVCIDCGKFL
jgi:hypothetical protein